MEKEIVSLEYSYTRVVDISGLKNQQSGEMGVLRGVVKECCPGNSLITSQYKLSSFQNEYEVYAKKLRVTP